MSIVRLGPLPLAFDIEGSVALASINANGCVTHCWIVTTATFNGGLNADVQVQVLAADAIVLTATVTSAGQMVGGIGDPIIPVPSVVADNTPGLGQYTSSLPCLAVAGGDVTAQLWCFDHDTGDPLPLTAGSLDVYALVQYP